MQGHLASGQSGLQRISGFTKLYILHDTSSYFVSYQLGVSQTIPYLPAFKLFDIRSLSKKPYLKQFPICCFQII